MEACSFEDIYCKSLSQQAQQGLKLGIVVHCSYNHSTWEANTGDWSICEVPVSHIVSYSPETLDLYSDTQKEAKPNLNKRKPKEL